MTRRRARTAAVAALALAGTVAVGACGTTSTASGNAGTACRTPTASASRAPTTPAPGASSAPTTGPTSGWGPDMWSGQSSGMMGGGSGSWGPGMMGSNMMGNWWLAGNGHRVQTLGQARQRATAFADRLGLRVGEVMQFSRNFYAELETTGGRPATEVLVNPADGAVQIEYGPAMMWNTAYGMHYGGRNQARVSATQAQDIARQWLREHGSTLTTVAPESYPGYYTLHTMQSGKITGMLSVNAATGQVWDHTWHGTYVATSRR